MMKKSLFIVLILLSTHVISNDVPNIQASFKTIELSEFTPLELLIFPDAGTQLVFPFKLDNPELEPVLKMRLTNGNGFDVPTETDDIETLLEGQNTITILGKVNENALGSKYVGNLFITIGGYNLSIVLKTTHDENKHISNVVFKESKANRDHMVERLTKRKTKALEEEYKKKLENIDSIARNKSLSHIAEIARITPRTTRFKEEGKVSIDEANLNVFADKVLSYRDKYAILYFEIDNKSSKDFELNDVNVYAKKDDSESEVSGDLWCDDKLYADQEIKCSFVTTSNRLPKADALRLSLSTDRGQGDFIW